MKNETTEVIAASYDALAAAGSIFSHDKYLYGAYSFVVFCAFVLVFPDPPRQH